jgi:hypothetical protein
MSPLSTAKKEIIVATSINLHRIMLEEVPRRV